MDLISYDVRNGPPEGLQEVPVKEILQQHRRRYVVRTSLGDLTLRFVGPIDKRVVTLRLTAEAPEYLALVERAAQLSQLSRSGVTLTEQDLQDAEALAAKIEPYLYEFFALAFASPTLSGAEDLKALANALQPQEWEELRPLLIELTRDEPAGFVDTSVVRLAQRFGIPIGDGMTAENMTCQQAAVLAQALEDDARELRQAQEGA